MDDDKAGYHQEPALHDESSDKAGCRHEPALHESSGGWFRTVFTAASNRSFAVLVIAFALLSGVSAGWQGLLESILSKTDAEPDAGWIGFGNGVAENIGAVLAGLMLDSFFRQRLKLGIVVGLAGCCLSTVWFSLQLPCGFIYGDSNPLPRSKLTMILSLTLAGFFQGITSPLSYELSAELIYPIKEACCIAQPPTIANYSHSCICPCTRPYV